MNHATNPLSWTFAYIRESKELHRMEAMTEQELLKEMPRWGYSPERGDTPAEALEDQRAMVAHYKKMAIAREG